MNWTFQSLLYWIMLKNASQNCIVELLVIKMKIKAHKGGRDKNIICRVTQEEKELVDNAKENLSYSDFLIKKAKDTLRRRRVI